MVIGTFVLYVVAVVAFVVCTSASVVPVANSVTVQCSFSCHPDINECSSLILIPMFSVKKIYNRSGINMQLRLTKDFRVANPSEYDSIGRQYV